jgi:response regulator RpfG family c-di-GMP phosphodiesterase
LRNDKHALQQMQQRLTESFNRLLSVLLYVLDLRVPGAAARGERLAGWAIKVAKRFDIPKPFLEDLRLAALLHEIGRVVEPSTPRTTSHTPAGFPHDWAYTVASKAILRRVERLNGAAVLVSAIYENWDGTGMPNRWRKGQIPLRSRILRVLIDFFTTLAEDGPKPISSNPLEGLSRYRGTRYDPVVVQHLAAVISSCSELPLADTRYRVVIGELEGGMVLAEDLCSASGVKLLAGGSTITPQIVELLRKRDQTDPVIDAPWIRR